jgi:spore maturation protein CgeB
LKPLELNIVVIGLSITSSWGNGHATTYRCLLRGLAQRGHRILFLERDVPWYAKNRDLSHVPYANVKLYCGLDELRDTYRDAIRQADLVIIGSFVPDGAKISHWMLEEAKGVTAFYDIDTPVTLEKVEAGNCEYLTRELIPRYNLYLSFTGGPALAELERVYGARLARPLYCAVDPDDYFPEEKTPRWDLAFMGTYSVDRQASLHRLLISTAKQAPELKFAVAGSMYPADIEWPKNVNRIEHLAPGDHRHFYNSQTYALNLTRIQMIRAGYSPSVRIFEAAACGTPILSDFWPGLDEFFVPGKEILVVRSTDQVLRALQEIPEEQRRTIAEKARITTLAHHTGEIRSRQLEEYYLSALPRVARPLSLIS